jgi:hypothetical protein
MSLDCGPTSGRQEICFASIRDDWYKANQLLPRVARKAILKSSSILFRGFPRQWIPLWEYYGLAWVESCAPSGHIPLVSELSEAEMLQHCETAKRNGTLRCLVESVVTLDPVLADALYILDNSIPPEFSTQEPFHSSRKQVRLTNWQSYGRPEVRRLELAIGKISVKEDLAIVLPCSRHRPYGTSRTHVRIWRTLRDLGFKPSSAHQVVFTSLAIVPQELWNHPIVIAYDAGVPDIYRLLRLARSYFSRNSYKDVIDCLEFEPYSDVLAILSREGLIRNLIKGPVRRNRQFFLKA